MDPNIYTHYLEILKSELVPALGCTEPIAVAYGAACAARLLGQRPERMELLCSGNIIKNVQGVTVPNSDGQKGICAAAILGALGGDPDKQLQVLEGVDPAIVEETKALNGTDYCKGYLAEGVANLYILVKAYAGSHCAEVEISHKHTNITKKVLDGEVVYQKEDALCDGCVIGDKNLLNVADILTFAAEVKLEDVQEVLDNQINLNTAISEEGLHNRYGVSVGQTILAEYGSDVKSRAKARAAAGSDARMSGCPLPVVINSGSGNQGMTVSLPVIEYAKELGASRETLYRALVVSNLIALHQKKYIGNLSAFCGAVCAACGSGAAITWLHGGGYQEVSNTITNTLANVGGIVCDGAKPSCAAKIASAVDAAIMAHHMSVNNRVFASGEGLVRDDVERTIQNIGHVGREGMKSTDIEILKVMLS